MAVLTAGLFGCASVPHLYSPTRDAQGKAAKDAWKNADVFGVVGVERERSAALLDQEVLRVVAGRALIRNLELFSVAAGQSLNNYLAEPVRSAASAAAGSASLKADLEAAKERQRRFVEAFDTDMMQLQAFGFEPVSCDDLVRGRAQNSMNAWLDTAPAVSAGLVRGALIHATRICNTNGADATAVHDLVVTRTAALGTSPKPLLLAEVADLYTRESLLKNEKGAHAIDRNRVRFTND